VLGHGFLKHVSDEIIDGFSLPTKSTSSDKHRPDEHIETPARAATFHQRIGHSGLHRTGFAMEGKFDGSTLSCLANELADSFACRALRSHAPSVSNPDQGAARKRIFDASCPACLRR
jgi:hypothetical protein